MNISQTIAFANKAHKNQLYGDVPYVVHLIMVARHFTDPEHMKIALLHDILEDTDVTESELRELFGNAIADAVVALTRQPDESYLPDYILRVKKNEQARRVKVADLHENMFSAEHFYPGRYSGLLDRYKKALGELTGSDYFGR